MAQGKIQFDVGMNNNEFMANSREISRAISSLKSTVAQTGQSIKASASNYGSAFVKGVQASRSYEDSIQRIRDRLNELRGSAASIEWVANNFRALQSSISSAELEMQKLTEQQKALAVAGKNRPSDEWMENQSRIALVTEELEKQKQAYQDYVDAFQYAEKRLATGKDEWGHMLTDQERKTYDEEANYNMELANSTVDRITAAESALQSLKQTEAELIAQGKNLLPKEWLDNDAQIKQQESRLNEMRTQLEKMRESGYENADQSEQYIREIEQIRKLEAALEAVEAKKNEAFRLPELESWKRMATMSGMIGNAIATAITPIMHPIQAADRALGFLIANVGRLASSLARMAGNAAMSFLRNLAATAQNAAIQLARLVPNAVISGLGRLASAAGNAAVQLARMVGNAIQSGLSKIGHFAADASKKLLGLGKSARKSGQGFATSFKTILKYAFGVRSMYFLFRRLRQAFVNGIKEIAKKNPELQASLNSLSKSFNALKGSIASAFAPIVTAVAPALTMLMNMLTNAMNTIGAFFAALTGKTSYQKSIGKVGNAAKKSSKDVKDLNRQLADFDHLNILTDKDKNDNGGNDNGSGLGYETVPIPNAIKDFVDQIKALWNAEDFEGIGALFAEKINGVFEKIDNAIKWDNVGEKITKFVNAITGIFNGLIYNIDWGLIGKTFGDGINTIVNTLNLLIEGIDWTALGSGIARGLNNLIDTVDWDNLGRLFANRINMVIWTLYGVVRDFDFVNAGKKLAEGLSSLLYNIDWETLGQMLYKLCAGALDFIYEAFTKIRWSDIIDRFKRGFNTFVTNIGNKLKEFIPKAEEMGETFANAITDLLKIDWVATGKAFAAGFNVVVTFLRSAITNLKYSAPQIGRDLADAVDAFINEVLWTDIGETINSLFVGSLDFAGALLQEFEEKGTATTLGNNISSMLGRIPWGEIATKTWENIKKAFSLAGNFIDALFSEPIDSSKISGQYFKEVTEFNAKPIGERIFAKIQSVFQAVPWSDMAATVWGWIKTAFTEAGNFIDAMINAEGKNGDDLAGKLGEQVQKMLGEVQWGRIAETTWSTIKTVFARAGSFVDALFSEPIDSSKISGQYFKEVTEFNAKPLSERIALKIKGVFEAIPWKDIADTTWQGIKEAFKIAGDFVATLLGAEDASPAAIGKAVGEKLADIPWASIFETLKETIMGFLNPAIKELLGSKDGRVFIAVSGALLALQLGLGKLITGMFAGLAGTIGAGGVVIAGAIADVVGIIKAVDLAKEIDQSADDLKASIQKQLDTLKGYYDRGEEELAAVYARAAFGVDISGKSYQEALKTSTDAIRELYKDAPTSWFDALFSTNETVADQVEAEGQKSIQMYYLGFMNELGNTGEITKEFSDTLDSILIAADYNGGGETSAERFYNGFVYAITNNNGKVESQYKETIEKIFGSVEPFEKGTITIEQFYEAFQKGAVDESGKLTPEFKAIMESVYASVDSKKHGDDYVTSLYNTFKTKIMDNGSVKKEYRAAFEEIFGSVSGLEDGTMTAEQFFNGWNKGVADSKTPAQEAIVGVFEDAVKEVNDTLGIASPSTVAAAIAKFFLEGFAQGAENNQEAVKTRVSAVFKGISDAVSNVADGVKGFFSKLLGGGDSKDASTGVSAEDIAKPYEEGANRAKVALDNLAIEVDSVLGNISKYVDNLKSSVVERVDDIQTAVIADLKWIKGESEKTNKAVTEDTKQKLTEIDNDTAKKLTGIKKGIETTLTPIKNNVAQVLGLIKSNVASETLNIKNDVAQKLGLIKSNVASETSSMKNTTVENMNNMRENFVDNTSTMETQANRAFSSMANDVEDFGDAANDASDDFDDLSTHVADGIRDIVDASRGMNEVEGNVSSAIRDAYHAARQVDFTSVGEGIINGMVRGINNGWSYVVNAARNVAQAALNAAKSALGVHSPSTVFRDEVGVNIVLGMAEGLKDAEPKMLKTISDIARNATEEMTDAKISANVDASGGLVDGLDDVLSTFSDKISNSFTNLIDKLSAISNAVTFREPAIAAGSILPYSVSGNSASDSKGIVEAQAANNDVLMGMLIQLVNNQTSALVGAIQQSSKRPVSFDVVKYTDLVIDEINRRTRASGKSPLLN